MRGGTDDGHVVSSFDEASDGRDRCKVSVASADQDKAFPHGLASVPIATASKTLAYYEMKC